MTLSAGGPLGSGEISQAPRQVGPAGIGGWLILVIIGLIFNPIRLLLFVVQTYPPIFTTGAWEALTTPGGEHYDALWAPLLIFEVAGNALFIIAAITLLVLLLRRSRWFPRLYVAVAFANLAFILLDAWLGSLVIVDEPMFDPATLKELFRSLVGVCIWVPYMRLSQRVKNTFVL